MLSNDLGGFATRNRAFVPAAKVGLLLLSLLSIRCGTIPGQVHQKERDPEITAAVHARLASDDNLTCGSAITVRSERCNVYLSGTVANQLERLRAAEVARTVKGTCKVTNNLEIGAVMPSPPPSREGRGDQNNLD